MFSSSRSTRLSRRSVLVTGTLLAALPLAACSDEGADEQVQLAAQSPQTAALPVALPDLSVALSRALFQTAPAAILTDEQHAAAFAGALGARPIPLLVGIAETVGEELDRLGASTLIVPTGMDAGTLAEGREVSEADPADPAGALPETAQPEQQPSVSLLRDPQAPEESRAFATAVVESVGGSAVDAAGADPRVSSESIEATKSGAGEDPARGVLALTADGSGDAAQLTARAQSALSVPELPGGGQLVVPFRRMVAAYGSPGVPSLGILGEQDLPATIERVTELAAEYEPFSDVPVIPAFEIISTVASASAGADGNYSTVVDRSLIQEWIDAAGEAGVYVVLDLQPGRNHFLDQAKLFEEQLLFPHVGLALDPEWRLKPNQVHLRQIGGVDAAEVNETATWLADLTRDNALPQKVLILHQFSTGMLRDREQIDASREELAFLLHADGHGTPDLKMGTWNALQQNLPEGIHMAWKNFYDEDTPTFTPEQTYQVEPRPWFVSYQ